MESPVESLGLAARAAQDVRSGEESASLPGLLSFWLAWAGVGAQSFGGGTSTLFLIHRLATGRRWLSEAEFARLWALVQVAPGINLIKLTMLIGYRVRGVPGLILATSGLLLPSALITVLMTAGFALVRDHPLMQAAMRGVMPATVGLGVALGVDMAAALVGRSYREGWPSLMVHLAIMLLAATALVVWQLSPILVLLASGVVGVWALGRTSIADGSSGYGGRSR